MSAQERDNDNKSMHEQAQEILPWLVNGTLNETEQSLVNDHLNECSECSRDVQELLETSRLFNNREDDTSTAPFQQARENFLAQLDTVSQDKPEQADIGIKPPAWVMPFALAASLLLASVFLSEVLMPWQGFETLSNKVANDSPVIQIVFHPKTLKNTTFRQLFINEGRIISGPSAQGVYRLELTPGKNKNLVLKQIQAHPAVLFAQMEDNP